MSTLPTASFGTIPTANGSVTYNWQGFDIIGAVNGPIEAQRRDEIPEEAFIEVNVRAATGPGGEHGFEYFIVLLANGNRHS